MRQALVLVSLALALSSELATGAEEKKLSNLQCYVCNTYHDKDCGDPFDSSKLGAKFLKSCEDPALAPTGNRTDAGSEGWKPVGCRKIDQEVDEDKRVIRECAYSGNAERNVKRTGNKGVRSFYHQCDDGSKCNGAPGRVDPAAALGLPLVFGALLALVPRFGV